MIGKRIKELRLNAGLTQSELAIKLNVSDKTVSSWESGRTEPSFEMVNEMAYVFQCAVIDIVENDRDHYAGQHVKVSDTEKQIIEYYRKLSPREQENFYRMMSYILAFNDMKAGGKNEDTENRKNR